MHTTVNSFLFDTNALIYWAYSSSSYHEVTSHLLYKILANKGSAYALSSSLNDVYYILRKHYTNEEDARESVRDIAEVFDLVDLTGLIVFDALDSSEPDYEDGLIRAAAEALQVDAIVSYDKQAFKESPIPAITAEEALAD